MTAANSSQNHFTKFKNSIEKVFVKDIELISDKKVVPTIIKSTGSNTVWLSDANRFFNLNTTYRLFVLKYRQTNEFKMPDALYEFIITPSVHNAICGELPLDKVESFHNELQTFDVGQEQAILARAWANDVKTEFETKYDSVVKLNYKVDNFSQRRLQASISLMDLISNVPCENTTVYEANSNGVIEYSGQKVTPIKSKSRVLKQKAA